jgi:hypothetical protein
MGSYMKSVVNATMETNMTAINLLRWGQSPHHWTNRHGTMIAPDDVPSVVYAYMTANRNRSQAASTLLEAALQSCPPDCDPDAWACWAEASTWVYHNKYSCVAGERTGSTQTYEAATFDGEVFAL